MELYLYHLTSVSSSISIVAQAKNKGSDLKIDQNSIVDLLTSIIHVTLYCHPIAILAPFHMLIYITFPHNLSMSTTCHLQFYATSVQ